jgi:rifampin ADP-ribosylating transferase
MQFDPTNPIVQLCVKGIELEGENSYQAKALFLQAWNQASTEVEKFIAAHYLARHQNSVAEKLEWDLEALQLALEIQDGNIISSYPSLYLNVGKGYEELGDIEQAKIHYQLASSYTSHLADEGYGKMIKQGIENALKRLIV